MRTSLAPSNSPQTLNQANEEVEINLLGLALVISARWRLIVSCVVVAALLGGLIGLVRPLPYEAVATVAIVKTSTRLEFDPRFKTRTQEEIINIPADTRRATLVGLVESSDLASRVVRRISSELTEKERNPAELLDKVAAEISGRGDLILIKVRDQNPQKAASVANAWAREYELYVNELFSSTPSSYIESVTRQYQQTLEEFQKAQNSLEQFIARSRIDELSRTISQTSQVLDLIMQGKQAEIAQIIEGQVKVKEQAVKAYLNAQLENELIAFLQEQESRRELFRAYLNAQAKAPISVFNEQVLSNLRALQELYAARLRTRLLISDAKAMLEQVKNGGNPAARSNQLALSLLKLQAFGLTLPISASLQVQEDGQLNPPTATEQIADLEGLIIALEQREVALTKEINSLSDQLIAGENYRIDTLFLSANSPLSKAISTTYTQLFEIGDIGRLRESMPITNQLTEAVRENVKLLSLARAEAYLSEFTTDDDGEVVRQLQEKIRMAKAALEKEQALLSQLKQDRDLKLEALEALARKQSELALASAVIGSEVRLASLAFPPNRRVLGPIAFVAIAALIGLFIGLIAALIIHTFLESTIMRISNQKGAFGRLVRWVLTPTAG